MAGIIAHTVRQPDARGLIMPAADKDDIAQLRGNIRKLIGETRSVRRLIISIGAGLAALTIILKYLG